MPRQRKVQEIEYDNRVYCIGRNAGSKAALEHQMPAGVGSVTSCGVDITRWSVQYTNARFDSILCKRRACRD